MSMFFDILDCFPNPRVLFLDKYDTPLFAFSQSGVETLSSDLFVGDDMLRWGEIKEIFILWARLGGLQIPTIRLVNLDEVLHRLPEAKAERLSHSYRSWLAGVSLNLSLNKDCSIRIDSTPVYMAIEKYEPYNPTEAFRRVVARFSLMYIRTIEQSTPEYKNMYEANRRTSQA